MKWHAVFLALCTIVTCFFIASETASAQTYGGYEAGFVPSPYNGYPQPYYGYNPRFAVGSYVGWNSYGMGSQVAYWRNQGSGYFQISIASDWPTGRVDHRCNGRRCRCRR